MFYLSGKIHVHHSNLVVALTDYEKRFLIKKGIDEEKITVIGPGVNPQKFSINGGNAFRRKCNLTTEPVVLYVGRKVNNKGIETLVEAMKIVWREKPDVRLVIAGERTKTKCLFEIEIEKLKEKEKIINIDNFSEDEKSDIFSSCDIFILPSINESFGIVFLEAWMHKKPVIGCKNSAPAEVIRDRVDGLLAEYGNPTDIAEKILMLLNNEKMRKRLGNTGRKKVLENYTWDIVGKKIQNKYRELQKRK